MSGGEKKDERAGSERRDEMKMTVMRGGDKMRR